MMPRSCRCSAKQRLPPAVVLASLTIEQPHRLTAAQRYVDADGMSAGALECRGTRHAGVTLHVKQRASVTLLLLIISLILPLLTHMHRHVGGAASGIVLMHD